MKLGTLIKMVAAAALLGHVAYAGSTKPNAHVIIANDLGYEMIGTDRMTDIETLHPDMLAEQGATFTHSCNVSAWDGAIRMANLNNGTTETLVSTPLAGFVVAQTATDRFPDFDWGTVPRYMHVRKATAFTPEEIQYLASFPLITFEKTTGIKDYGSTEAGTLRVAEAVKRINPRTKILYYRNVLVHYAAYDADQELVAIPNAFLANRSGNTKLVRGQVPAYDLSNQAVQVWWLIHARQICSSKYIDGLFVDGNIKVLEPGYLRQAVGEIKKAAVEDAYHHMMKKLPEILGPEKLVLANMIRARFDQAGLEYLDYFDGSYIEGLELAVGGMSREEYLAKGIAAIQSAARKGKIIAFTIGMGKANDTELGIDESRSPVTDLAAMQERFIYSLALFLICAEKQSYFMVSDGYGVDGGRSALWMKEIPEYTYPLGAPKGPAVKDGSTYRRVFEHASVRVDIQKQMADIVWENKANH